MGERASPAIHTAHYFDTAEGTMSDLTPSAFWDEMSVAVLHSVAALLDESSMQQASGLKPVVGAESGGAACRPIASVDRDGAVDGAPNNMGREFKGPADTLEELASGLSVGKEGDLPAELYVEPAGRLL
ncbi:hypothetical protein WJX79_000677 [Trebouxia sp. C0005]